MNLEHSTRHGIDFLLLVLILGLGLGGILFFVSNKPAQIITVLTMCLMYIFWGLYHHHHDGHLSAKIFLEYTGISILVGTLLIIFLMRV